MKAQDLGRAARPGTLPASEGLGQKTQCQAQGWGLLLPMQLGPPPAGLSHHGRWNLATPPKTSVSPGVRWPSLLWDISIASRSLPQVTPSSGAQFHDPVTPAIPLSQCHEGSTSPRCPRHPPQSQGSRALQVCAGVCGERGVLWGGGLQASPRLRLLHHTLGPSSQAGGHSCP